VWFERAEAVAQARHARTAQIAKLRSAARRLATSSTRSPRRSSAAPMAERRLRFALLGERRMLRATHAPRPP
jgi:hypothetical protein